MQDYEKLGAFYMGKVAEDGKPTDELLLYDSSDLTTHAVIIGMTGSGKTGLGIGLLEEAAMDKIPVIAVDPKGDLTNLLLSFPNLAPEDFKPWINQEEAQRQGMDADAFAKAQAEMWTKGLADWGQDADRIKRLRENADFAIYTPGSSAGLQVSVLKSFDAPPEAVRSDSDALRERIQTTATGLLGLLGIDADPIKSREHILVSNILSSAWSAGQNLDLGAMIQAIQKPSFEKIGVLDLESFYPAKERFELAMTLNNLLASPGFQSWMEGEPLNIKNMLYTDTGTPRLTVFSISHLGDAERMFFVTQLLNEMLGWMRSQPGTSSLRAILYMDEIFGYFPPNGNPPSKTPMLTLLKQARAFGLGLVLATQNPVDLDYKGLSNTGTWFIGRLQTENDKSRVLEALEGAMAGQNPMSRGDLDKMLSGLGKRVFLMHNVHEGHPVIFQTRWTMSYLAGPMTGDQIKKIMNVRKTQAVSSAKTVQDANSSSVKTPSSTVSTSTSSRPLLPPQVKQYFVPTTAESGVIYYPMVIGAAQARYSSPKYKIDTAKTLRLLAEIGDGPVPIKWDDATTVELELDALETEPTAPGEFADLPSPGTDAKNYDKWQKEFSKWVAQTQSLVLFESKANKLFSNPDESEADFRARLTHTAREDRDALKDKLRQKYAPKLQTLQDKLARAQANQEQQAAQARQKGLETAVNVGMGVLGALFGGGRRTSSVVSAASRAVKSAGRTYNEAQDIGRAADTVEGVQTQIAALNQQLEDELNALETVTDEQFEEVRIKPKTTDVNLELVALAWVPYTRNDKGVLNPAF
jgi:Helicase HerA, central domain